MSAGALLGAAGSCAAAHLWDCPWLTSMSCLHSTISFEQPALAAVPFIVWAYECVVEKSWASLRQVGEDPVRRQRIGGRADKVGEACGRGVGGR